MSASVQGNQAVVTVIIAFVTLVNCETTLKYVCIFKVMGYFQLLLSTGEGEVAGRFYFHGYLSVILFVGRIGQ